MSIEDFRILKTLGAGAYGKVCLVQKLSSGDCFAMKIIDREKTMEKGQEEFVASEVSVLKQLTNEYVVKLYYTFQNHKYLFFVMEYMVGGDLGNLLENCGSIEEQVSILA